MFKKITIYLVVSHLSMYLGLMLFFNSSVNLTNGKISSNFVFYLLFEFLVIMCLFWKPKVFVFPCIIFQFFAIGSTVLPVILYKAYLVTPNLLLSNNRTIYLFSFFFLHLIGMFFLLKETLHKYTHLRLNR